MPSHEIVKYETLDAKIQKLLNDGITARTLAYCPYSNFKVGAALLTQDGTIYQGCNVENASLGASICAERTAYVKAISDGKQKFKALAVIALQEHSFTTPCGICRQFMSEFGNIDIYVGKPGCDKVLVTDLNELLPFSFSLSDNPEQNGKEVEI